MICLRWIDKKARLPTKKTVKENRVWKKSTGYAKRYIN